jgi:hypothetical protein
MRSRAIALSIAACLVAAALFAEEPECATNYRSDGQSAETFVTTSLAPKVVIERLPRMLIGAGATMRWTEPEKGLLKAEGLDVKAEASGSATRVTFRLATAADKAAVCRYASLVGNPPLPPVPQDPARIAQIKDDLIKLHRIEHRASNGGIDTATVSSREDFLELTIKKADDFAAGKRQTDVSMLVPRAACDIASEDVAAGIAGFAGHDTPTPTKPVRIEASLIYTKSGDAWQLTEVKVSQIESTK